MKKSAMFLIAAALALCSLSESASAQVVVQQQRGLFRNSNTVVVGGGGVPVGGGVVVQQQRGFFRQPVHHAPRVSLGLGASYYYSNSAALALQRQLAYQQRLSALSYYQQPQLALSTPTYSYSQQSFRSTTYAAPFVQQLAPAPCGGGMPPQLPFAPAPGGCGSCSGGGTVPSTALMLQRFGY